MPSLRISLAKAMAIVALTAVVLGILIVPMGRHMEWYGLARQMDASIRYLRPTRTNSIRPGEWECAHGWVVTAYGNICFSPENTPTVEMYRLRDDLERQSEGTIDLDSLRWIWIRLGETGPHGKRYTERFGPSFRECLEHGKP